jgi:hypothetical protein
LLSNSREADEKFDKAAGFYSALVMYDHFGPSLKVLKTDHVAISDDSTPENDFAASSTSLWTAIFNVPTNLWSASATDYPYNWMNLGTDREPTAYHRFFLVRPDKDAARWTSIPSYPLDLITDFMALVFISAVQSKYIAEQKIEKALPNRLPSSFASCQHPRYAV